MPIGRLIPIVIGISLCILAVLLPHSLCRRDSKYNIVIKINLVITKSMRMKVGVLLFGHR
jgi:hypothetical protein